MNENVTMGLVCGIVTDFMNQVNAGDEFAFEKAVHALKDSTELNDEQEAMVRNSLLHLEIIAQKVSDEEIVKRVVGMECNILLWTVAADWHCLNTRTLGDNEQWSMSGDSPLTDEKAS